MSALSKKLRSIEGGRIAFWCPGCECMHLITVNSPTRPSWTFDGNVDEPTFSPSILVTYEGTDAGHDEALPARCHSFVRQGRIEFCGDSTHALAGKTVPLPDFP